MPKRPNPPRTVLGAAIQAKRDSQHSVAATIGVPRGTLASVERGDHAPSVDTAIALARWLGWSVEQVIEAARTPVDVDVVIPSADHQERT